MSQSNFQQLIQLVEPHSAFTAGFLRGCASRNLDDRAMAAEMAKAAALDPCIKHEFELVDWKGMEKQAVGFLAPLAMAVPWIIKALSAAGTAYGGYELYKGLTGKPEQAAEQPAAQPMPAAPSTYDRTMSFLKSLRRPVAPAPVAGVAGPAAAPIKPPTGELGMPAAPTLPKPEMFKASAWQKQADQPPRLAIPSINEVLPKGPGLDPTGSMLGPLKDLPNYYQRPLLRGQDRVSPLIGPSFRELLPEQYRHIEGIGREADRHQHVLWKHPSTADSLLHDYPNVIRNVHEQYNSPVDPESDYDRRIAQYAAFENDPNVKSRVNMLPSDSGPDGERGYRGRGFLDDHDSSLPFTPLGAGKSNTGHMPPAELKPFSVQPKSPTPAAPPKPEMFKAGGIGSLLKLPFHLLGIGRGTTPLVSGARTFWGTAAMPGIMGYQMYKDHGNQVKNDAWMADNKALDLKKQQDAAQEANTAATIAHAAPTGDVNQFNKATAGLKLPQPGQQALSSLFNHPELRQLFGSRTPDLLGNARAMGGVAGATPESVHRALLYGINPELAKKFPYQQAAGATPTRPAAPAARYTDLKQVAGDKDLAPFFNAKSYSEQAALAKKLHAASDEEAHAQMAKLAPPLLDQLEGTIKEMPTDRFRSGYAGVPLDKLQTRYLALLAAAKQQAAQQPG